MTPAVEQLRAAGIDHRVVGYDHTPGAAYGPEAVEALGLAADQVINVSAGRRGLELVVAPHALVDVLGATVADLGV